MRGEGGGRQGGRLRVRGGRELELELWETGATREREEGGREVVRGGRESELELTEREATSERERDRESGRQGVR